MGRKYKKYIRVKIVSLMQNCSQRNRKKVEVIVFMDFSKFIEKSALNVQKFIKCEGLFDLENVSEKDDIDFYSAVYLVRSNITRNIFIVRYYYEVEDDEFEENYVVLSKSNCEKFVKFIKFGELNESEDHDEEDENQVI